MKTDDIKISFQKFNWRFPSKNSCLKYIQDLRRPAGFVCTRVGCDSNTYWKIDKKNSKKNNIFNDTRKCAKCYKVSTLTTGTVFHSSKIDMYKWFKVGWAVCNIDINAAQLQQYLKIKTHVTIWKMLSKMREVMENSSKPLNGNIKVTIIDMPVRRNAKSTEKVKKTLHVLVAIEFEPQVTVTKKLYNRNPEEKPKDKVSVNKVSRIYMQPFETLSSEIIAKALSDNFDEGCKIYTNTSEYFEDLDNVTVIGEKEQPDFFKKCKQEEKTFKDWLIKKYRTYTTGNQLRYYLAEYCFKKNHELLNPNKDLFDTLIESCAKPHKK